MAVQQKVGPHPSYVEIRKQFITEEKIQDFTDHAKVNPAKEESMRLQGVAWIDNVRKVLRLYATLAVSTPCVCPRRLLIIAYSPIRTFDTAVVSYHKFRLGHPDVEYNYVVSIPFSYH